jgi:glycosyltransferase involved in cell wall biosynthesis
MLIGVDASRAVSASPTGTETYSRRLTEALLELDTDHAFRLYLRERPNEGDLLPAEHRVMRFPRLWTHARLSWEMAAHEPDALFVPAHVLPFRHPRASVVTVHDLGYLEFPKAHPRGQRWYLDRSTRWSIGAAAHLLADSLFTKNDLAARYGVPIARITVAYPGIDERLARVNDRARIDALLARLGIRAPYFLYLGTLQPRKNLARLLDAFAAFDTSIFQVPPSLVIAGKQGWMYEDLLDKAGRLGVRDRTVFPGYIDDRDKATLISGALAFVFPSLYEGFGLPVIEAQACGCPVVASSTSSLPEVAGRGALLVDPGDTTALRDALWRISTDTPLRRSLVASGYANVRRFSWKACAETALHAIERSVRAARVAS